MKKFYVICLILLASCSSNYFVQIQPPLYLYAIREDLPLVEVQRGNILGDSVGVWRVKIGELIPVYGRCSSWGEVYYLVHHGDKKYYVNSEFLVSECYFEIFKNNITNFVIVDKEKLDLYWGRAIAFILKYSDMRIELQTDYLIQTFNPIRGKNIGFIITKEPLEDGKVKITTSVLYLEKTLLQRYIFRDAKKIESKCSYFILTGKDCD